jgi:hypothetical protein
MNQFDIEMVYNNRHACPNVRKAVRLLYRLMVAVNSQSDGWAYWHAPSRACRQLMELLQTVGNLWHDTHGTITDAQLRKAVAPIKAMVTRETERQKKYGNTFAFDVAAALEEHDGVHEPSQPAPSVGLRQGAGRP